MSAIPLELERRFEQRWAARFLGPLASVPPQKQEQEKLDQQLAAPATAKNENSPDRSGGLED
jgi:hypothetical protein